MMDEYKVIMLGDASVGKSSLVVRFTKGVFSVGMEPTIGLSFATATIKTSNGPVNLKIWDTAGSERYRSLAPKYIVDADFVIVVFDLQKQETLDETVMWMNMVREHHKGGYMTWLVGNKRDLVTNDDVSELRTSIDTVRETCGFDGFRITSAATGFGVTELFTEIGEFIMKNPNKLSREKFNLQRELDEIHDESSCC